MKSFIQAAACLSSFSSFTSASLVSSPSSLGSSSSFDITSVAGITGPDYVSISFNTPCQGCFVGTDDGLELTLDIKSAESECRAEAVYVNGAPVTEDHEHPIAGGLLRFPTRLTSGLGVREVEASFNFACLGDQASLVSVQILSIAGQNVPPVSGFTVSFSQKEHPEILRLQSAPLPSFESESSENTWVWPEPEKKPIIEAPPPPFAPGMPEGLQEEFLKLHILRFHLKELRKEVHEQEARIMSIWKSEFSKCSTVKCYFQTALEKLPIFAHLLVDHFRHHSHIDVDFFRNSTHENCSTAHGLLLTQQDEAVHAEIDDLVSLDEVADAQRLPHPSSSTENNGGTTPTPAPPSSPNPPHHPHPPFPPFAHPDGTPPWGKGPPPWGKGPPPWGNGPPPWFKSGRPPWAHPGGNPPWAHHDHPRPPFQPTLHRPPHFVPTLSSQQIFRIHLIGAMIGLLVVILIIACLATCIKHKVRIFRDPRRRAERAARREEFLTRREYKKAACKHKWRTFVRRLLRRNATSDYEEKRGILSEHDDVVVHREIRNLRAAHRLVGDMMRAEEGQSRFNAPTSLTRSPAELDASDRSSTRSDSLPSYSSAPPGYGQGLEGDISVVDGFTGYTPSNTDDTPDSSVVDCSPRMSFETQRTS